MTVIHDKQIIWFIVGTSRFIGRGMHMAQSPHPPPPPPTPSFHLTNKIHPYMEFDIKMDAHPPTASNVDAPLVGLDFRKISTAMDILHVR